MRNIPESVLQELANLAKKSEEDIDYSDISDTLDQDWSGAVRGKFFRPASHPSPRAAYAESQQAQEIETIHCPECGSPTIRDVGPRTVTYEGRSEVVEMPGWYCGCGEAIHSGADMAVWGTALRRLKGMAE